MTILLLSYDNLGDWKGLNRFLELSEKTVDWLRDDFLGLYFFFFKSILLLN